MKWIRRVAGLSLPAVALAALWCSPASAQEPAVVAPIIVDTAVPIVVNAVKPKPTGLAKFDGYVMNANTAQITVRAKGNDLGIQTFTLSQQASAKMQQVIDKGGYQHGDKVTVMYDPSSRKAIQVKGKPSRSF
ncbi:MAG: hypothetical protein ABSH13_07345 [Candidatus Acidiferrum sp.]|jgi:hypothetical protein